MNNFKVFVIFTVLLLAAGIGCLSAQSMDIMDRLIEQEEALTGESVYLIAVGSGAVSESASVKDAMSAAAEQKLIARTADPASPISAGELSRAVMKAFDIKGGVMYTLFGSPRYAARELAYLELLPPDIHPGHTLSGTDVVNIIAGAAAYKEAE